MDISKFVSVGEDGKIVVDNSAFQSEFDNAIRSAVEKNKTGKLREEIKKELEEEAKLSAEQKLQKEREEFEAFKLKSLVELNQAKAKAKLEGQNFSEKEVEFILNTITDNETSLTSLDNLISDRKTYLEKQKTDLMNSLQSQQENAKSNPQDNNNQNNNQQSTQNPTRTREQIANMYEKNENL